MTLLALYDQNLRINIAYPGVRKEVLAHLVRFIRPAPGMNFVAYSRLPERDMGASIGEQIAYFSALKQPFSWHVHDHDEPPGLKAQLVRHGFGPDDDPDAVMCLDLHKASPVDTTLDVRRLEDAAELEAVAHTEAQVWGGDFAWLVKRLGEHMAIPNYLSVYVAYVGDQAACSGWVYFHPGGSFASLYGGATLPGYRGRGLYRAVLAARVREAGERGYRFLATGASPLSRPILEQNGFRFLGYQHSLVWQAAKRGGP